MQFKTGASNITVHGCTLHDFPSRQYPAHGIYFQGSTGCVAYSNVIYNVTTDDFATKNEVSGIKFSSSTGSAYLNEIYNSIGGISIPGGHDVECYTNDIHDTTERGFYILSGAYACNLHNNTIDSTKYGFLFSAYTAWPNNVQITSNTATNCSVAYVSQGSAVNVTITGNSWQ